MTGVATQAPKDSRSRGRDPVVVTGAHRSGTTVLGDIVSRASGTWTVWEPFNRHWGLRGVDVGYPYLPRCEPPAPVVACLDRYLRTGRAVWSVKAGPNGRAMPRLRAAAHTARRWVSWRTHASAIPVVKDPFLMLALGAIQPFVTARPILVSVRHPCSWLLSLRRMSWPAGPELNHLLAQESLHEEHLSHLLARKDWTRVDDVESGATAWACLYHMVDVQRRCGARAVVLPLEHFGRDPVGTMRLMYAATSLPEPDDMEALATAYTNAGNAVAPDAGTKHLLQRDSRRLGDLWKSRLSREDISLVRRITEPVFDAVYTDWDTAEGPPSGLPAVR